MRCLVLLSIAAASLAFAPAPLPKPPRNNLLVNGSFEEGPGARTFVNLPGGSTAIRIGSG